VPTCASVGERIRRVYLLCLLTLGFRLDPASFVSEYALPMMNTSVAEAVRVARPGRASEHRFYLGVGVLVLVVSLAAFGPSILAPSSRNVPLPMTALVAAHGLISLAWLFLFLAQTTLAATGRTATHRRLGMIGISMHSGCSL
jgi:hypothetical protein